MYYGYLGSRDARGKRFRMRKGQYFAGYAMGIVVLEAWYPILPGDVSNASSFDFPVRYKTLRGATSERIRAADPTLLNVIIEAGRELEQEGVRAVVGACGFLGIYQQEVAAALNTPVFLSSLLQIPMIHRALKPQQHVGVICADASSLDQQTLAACGVSSDIPVVIKGLEDQLEFDSILEDRGEFDFDRLEQEVVESAQQLKAMEPYVGAILLECSIIPQFAAAVQSAVRLPVFDYMTMINWIYHGVVQRPHEGFC
jgi:hypothetical protein